MRKNFLIICLAICTVVALWFSAQPQHDIDGCYNYNKTNDQRITACTELLYAALYNRGNAYESKGEYDRAIADFGRLIELNPKSVSAFIDRGNAYNYKRDYDRAISDNSKAIELDPKSALALEQRGFAYIGKKDYDRSIADFSKAIELAPKASLAYQSRAFDYTIKGDYDHAIADNSKAIELDPKFVYAYSNRGAAYNSKGKYDRAIADSSKAIELDPKYALAFINRGYAYDNKGEYDHAIADYDKAIELDPKDIYSYLDRYLDEARSGKDGAQELAKGTLQLERKWPYPVVDFYLGKTSRHQMKSEANDDDKKCDLAYYTGEWELLKGDEGIVKGLLQKAVNTCPKKMFAYDRATAELKRMAK